MIARLVRTLIAVLMVGAVVPALGQSSQNEALVHEATHGDWHLSCFRNDVVGTVRCGLEQSQPIPGKDDAHAALMIQGDSEIQILVLISSMGFTPDGAVAVRIDDNQPVAATAIDDSYVALAPDSSAPLIEQMKAGQTFFMAYRAPDGDKVTVSFSLTGVTAGMNAFAQQVGG